MIPIPRHSVHEGGASVPAPWGRRLHIWWLSFLIDTHRGAFARYCDTGNYELAEEHMAEVVLLKRQRAQVAREARA